MKKTTFSAKHFSQYFLYTIASIGLFSLTLQSCKKDVSKDALHTVTDVQHAPHVVLNGTTSNARTIADYSSRLYQGFTIYTDKTGYNEDSVTMKEAFDTIKSKLSQIIRINPGNKLSVLKTIKIWLERSINTGSAVYHSTGAYPTYVDIPQKAGSVQITNVYNFLNWQKQSQPFMLFHELAHGFMERLNAAKRAQITNAYNAAVNSKKYEAVLYYGDAVNKYRHYGLTNEWEFFAEMSETVFGRNDFYPFTPQQLASYDLATFNAIKSVWNN